MPVPAALGQRVSRVVERLRRLPGGDEVRWVPRENLHVTLRFLGNIDPALAPELLECVGRETSALAPFELTLTGVSLFPSPKRPRVVAYELAPEAPLAGLAAAVERGVVAAGLPAEARPFRPHLTLGRIRERRTRFHVTASDTGLPDALPVSDAVLYQSQLKRSGALHTSLGRAPLGSRAGVR